MKFRSIAIILSFMPVFALAQQGDFEQGSILVKFKPGAFTLFSKYAINAVTVQTIKEIGVERLHVSGMTPEQAVKTMKTDPNVVYAELNPREHLFYTPNDPKLGQQYGIDQVRARQAWNISKGSSNTIVCVIDTGVRLDHEEFVGRIAPGCYDWSDNDGDVTDNTGSGHGTHTSGIAVAGTDNGKGVASVCFNGKLLHMKIFPNSFASTSASAIIDASNKGARVISMSYGSSFRSQTEQDAVNFAWSKNVVLFAAAGNDNVSTKFYPAGLDNIIAVGATNSADQKASFSNFGDWVPIAAPGEDILSTFFNSPTDYAVESGTSMACPFAASVAGLMIGRNPLITNARVRDILFTTTDNVGTWVTKGRVNAFKAIQQVIVPLPFIGTPISASVGVIANVTEGTQIGTYGNLNLAGQTIKSVDGINFTIQSLASQRVGGVATLDAFVLLAPPLDSLVSANINVTARATDGASCLVFLYNYISGGWDQFGSMSMASTNKSASFSISMATVGNYVNGSNIVRVMARCVAPARTSSAKNFLFVTDQLNITGTNKPSI